MSASLEDIIREVAGLSQADQDLVRDYVAFLRWRAGSDAAVKSERVARLGQPGEAAPGRRWRFSFLEQFATADVSATHDPTGMEVKIAEATVGGERLPALWQHPPVSGESVVEFHVPVPGGLRDLTLRFAIGIRDGAQAQDRLVAFRVRLDGWQVWSQAAWPLAWKRVELALPLQAGDVLRLAFVTDGLGAHQWAWAVWGEPELIGWEVPA